MGTVGPGRKLGFPRGADDGAASARAGRGRARGASHAACGTCVLPREQLLGRVPAPRSGGSGCPGSEGRVGSASLLSCMVPVSSTRLEAVTWSLLEAELHPQTPRASKPQSSSARIRGPHAVSSVQTKPSLAQWAIFTGLIGKLNHEGDQGSQARPEGSRISIYFTKMRIEKTLTKRGIVM